MNIPETPAIVVVDDDALYRKVLILLLKKHRFQIFFEAENGSDCLSRMAAIIALPHVVILDIEMPVMDGFETAKKLKEKWPQVKIVAHSAILDARARDKIMAAGADHFLVKGYESARIAEAVWLVLNEV
ncbi:Response regulator receiver domain-containing protein [Mucilaginibacter pineti]|uniref:Response regulator receiver domain-containing protein n=1 Tax=Mucilaginibacter pineti TaxID=1391627 RepID=A0A1G6Z5C9_9SPHI|nr:response regulator [Mucilaginibacter pineti]SDD97075.1 Response regulator receiver domain-containing protein [Mucilaginibacter pineti]